MPIATFSERFQALGTTVEGGFLTEPDTAKKLWADLRMYIALFEAQFSRFQSDSEITQLNRIAGQPFSASQEMIDLLTAAQTIWRETNGLVDPTIAEALVAAGYDRTFKDITDVLPNRPPPSPTTKTFSDVEINIGQRTVTLPPGVSIDIGGIGKGYLLDQLVPRIEEVTSNYWLSLGGDLIVSGKDEHEQSWSIGVQNPRVHEHDLAKLQPPPGRWAIATSGTTKRQGSRGGISWHHLIDPRTNQPAKTDVLAGVALAKTGIKADAFAKTILIYGSDKGLAWANQKHIDALMITESLKMIATPGIKKLLHYS